MKKLFCTFFVVLFASAVYAQTDIDGMEQHPAGGTSMRFPMDRNTPAPAHTEGILGHCFPNLHGNDAIHFDYVYTGGIFNNARGGIRSGTAYSGIFETGWTADTEKLGLWKNGTFFAHALFAHGPSPSRFVGDYQGLAMFAYETPAQVSEYWYEHRFFGDVLAIRAGKIDAGGDFFYLESTADFISSSGTCVPTTGIPTAPNNAWGMVVDFDVTDQLCVRFGLFDADGNANKIWMSESGNVYTSYQIEYHYSLFRYLSGFIYAGAWYNDSENTNFAGNTHFGKGGYSVGFEQMIFRTNYLDKKDRRGLTMFFQYSEPDADRENDLRQFWSYGLNWLGLFENRPNDIFGFGVFTASFDRNFEDEDGNRLRYGAERAYELYYKIALTDNVALQPVFQYIVHPGGESRNSFVPGLVFQVTF